MLLMQFEVFFQEVVGKAPFPYQARLADMPAGQFPRLLHVPTGAGKTAAVISAWLWRRFIHPDEAVRRETPRRLVYCLPSRVLVEQTLQAVVQYRSRFSDVVPQALGHSIEPPLATMLMGGAGEIPRSVRDVWRLHPEANQILVGTQDMLLSRALNRGYGAARSAWPREFGLLNNDVLWVFDEVQLMSSGLKTSVQLEGLRARFGVFGSARSLWLSATLDPSWLSTVDHPKPAETEVMRLTEDDRVAPRLAERLRASKSLRPAAPSVPEKAADTPAHVRQVALLAVERHRPETLSLIVVNTIPRAKAIYGAICRELERRRWTAEALLVHSHFREADRARLLQSVLSKTPPEGRIIVSTQVIEAGVDISAHVLFTEIAPWGSMVQRLGRCNRYGESADAEAYWFDVSDEVSAPYSPEELAIARGHLAALAGPSGAIQASPENLAGVPVPPPPQSHILRAPDLAGLFDTSPDLSGFDVDVSRFIRDSQDHDVQIFWRIWDEESPPDTMEDPGEEEFCPAPIGDVRGMLEKRRSFWRWDQLDGRWARMKMGDGIYPGQTLMLAGREGGYDPQTGWEPASEEPVEDVRSAIVTGGRSPAGGPDPGGVPAQAAFSADSASTSGPVWVGIAEHTDVTVEEIGAILAGLGWGLIPPQLTQALLDAARWHDRGKAHPVFQKTLLRAATDQDRAKRLADLWAKAPAGGTKHERRYFRHELASALAYLTQAAKGDGPPREAGARGIGADLADLVAYLIAAHHGRVRLAIRSMPREDVPDKGANRRFAMGIWEGDALPATELGGGTLAEVVPLDLSIMEIGRGEDGRASWVDRMTRLRDIPELGFFKMAFLEAILRAADSRASMMHERGGVTHA
jgi:CRISPR-associated endonuclease/helicase Cas3